MASPVDPFLCIVIACTTVGAACIAWYFYHRFRHPIEDHSQAYWPQMTVIFSITLTLLTVLMPPLDIANGNGGIPMDVLWYIVFYFQASMIFVVIPFAIFYYQAYDTIGEYDAEGNHTEPDACQMDAVRSALCYTTVSAVIVLTLIGIVWLWLGIAELEVANFSAALVAIPADNATMIGMTCTTNDPTSECAGEATTFEMDVTFPVYCMAITAFLGWITFAVFAGVGLYATPMDLINYFRSRTAFLDSKTRQKFMDDLGERAKSLHKILRHIDENILDKNEEIEKAHAAKIRDVLKDKEIVMSQFKNFRIIMDAEKDRELAEDNACFHWMALAAGIFSILLSFLWTLHILLYMFWEDPVYGFLNTFLVELDKVWGLFGVTLYGVFSFYLMLCVLKGNTKWGLGIGVCTLHPLELGNTLMQAFLVNTLLLALCSFSVVQFCMQAFKGYAGPNSSVTVIFNVAARNLKGLTYLYTNNVFVYILLVFAFLTLWFLWCCPPKKLDFRQHLQGAIEYDESCGVSHLTQKSGSHLRSQLAQDGVELQEVDTRT